MRWVDRTGTSDKICCVLAVHFSAIHLQVETYFCTDAVIHRQKNVHWLCSRMNGHDSAMSAVAGKISIIKTIWPLKVRLKSNAVHSVKLIPPLPVSVPPHSLSCAMCWGGWPSIPSSFVVRICTDPLTLELARASFAAKPCQMNAKLQVRITTWCCREAQPTACGHQSRAKTE